jgi:hypothetical protein
MAQRTVQGHDIGGRDEALAKGKAASASPPHAEARLRRRIKRLEEWLESQDPDSVGGGSVKAPVEQPR